MKAKIFLNQPLTQDRYGLHFDKGEALCDNEYIINKLQKKGVKVEIIKEEKKIDEMTVAELKEYATEKNITIPSNVKSKADIIEFIKNYKEGHQDNTGEKTDKNPDSTDTKPDNTEDNPDTKQDGSDTNVGSNENEE